jgi:hypothetical protein
VEWRKKGGDAGEGKTSYNAQENCRAAINSLLID